MNDSTSDIHPALLPHRVAVLGLGAMGAALARALVAAGHDVVVWNRSPKDLAPLGLHRSQAETDPAAAVRGAEVVLLCVLDHHASRAVIAQISASLPPGTPLVNLSTGTPGQAAESAAAASALGIAYLTGAVMVPTPMVGTPDNLVLYAGPRDVVAAARPVLESLGGTVDVLGEDHALPPVLDLAKAYESRTYDSGEATIEMCLSFLDHIVATSEAAGVDARLPRLVRDTTRAEAERRPRGIDWDVVAEGLSPA
jgi:NAD(P)-dependent dehydrogenase (short-subunit alcohol dehydrogenase family)